MITSVKSRSNGCPGLDDRERLRCVGRIQRDVAERMQLRQHIVAHQPVVLDDQDGFVAALQSRCGRGLGRQRSSCRRRQIHLDRRAVALLAVDLDVAGGLLDEAVDHAEAEAGALAGSLRGEERIEHLVEDAAGMPVPVSLTAIMA